MMSNAKPYAGSFCSMVDCPPASGLVLYDVGAYPRIGYQANTQWTWGGSSWTQFSGDPIAGTIPSNRVGQSAAFDGYEVVLFGGTTQEPYAQYLGDTWLFNGTSWSESTIAWGPATPNAAPAPRTKTTAVYVSSTHRTHLLFGYDQRAIRLEHWYYMHSPAGWTQLSIPLPTWRQDGVAASDGTNIVVFGGSGNGQFEMNDTWQYNGVVWSDLNTTNTPAIRSGAAMCYDPGNGVFTMFGGSTDGNCLFETWVFNLSTKVWTNATANSTTYPAARKGACLTYDSTHSQIVMFGGTNQYTEFNDTWVFSGGTGGTWSLAQSGLI
jgi:galactose oxidase-like protein